MNIYEEHVVRVLNDVLAELRAQQGGNPADSTIAPLVADLGAAIEKIEARAEQRLATTAQASQ